MSKLKHFKQPDKMSCGATCLKMVAHFYGLKIDQDQLIRLTATTKDGTNILGISEGAQELGFDTLVVKTSLTKLREDAPLPFIVHWNQNHFVVVSKISGNSVWVADPAHDIIKYDINEFITLWTSNETHEGVALLLEPGATFKNIKGRSFKNNSLDFLWPYFRKHKKGIIQLLVWLSFGSIIQLIFPFLTKAIVDTGIKDRDINFIYMILFAQVMLFLGKISIDVVRSYVLINLSTRINMNLVNDFFIKLMRLPISYFDAKLTGDLMQRISDNKRIENFFTVSSLNALFSVFTFLVFSVILAWFSIDIFLAFLIGTTLYIIWVSVFLKKRAEIDYKRFQQSGQNQSTIIELINGMQEIKLHKAETRKWHELKNLQLKLFKINLKGLFVSALQNSGSQVINELKNIIITFIAAKLVIDGHITLGVMLSISYIIGQLNSPVLEIVSFIQSWQDAKLSLLRLKDIHNRPDEDNMNTQTASKIDTNSDITIKDLSFKYEGAAQNLILKDLNLVIPAKKITAIVGASGSGKTTLLKLLLKFYHPVKGHISLNNTDLNEIPASLWREYCGGVLQEGFIFSDTIANNISLSETNPDPEKLNKATNIANIKDFIESLPLGYATKIGTEGMNLSTGQKQRILIARAVYKDPGFLFFDEATSALDANNEKIIIDNLNNFFKGKTVVIIAHRLSTVKNADHILVLNNGEIIESGTHHELEAKKGAYYQLVKNQLEFGK